MMSDDDFLNAMGDVKPIKKDTRVRLQKHDADSVSIQQRRHSAEYEHLPDNDPLANAEVDMLDANAVLEFQRPGVQHGVYRQLRLGKYDIEARLDLHRMSLEQARVAVYQFIKDCINHDIRCALVTHGKGEGRKTPALIKSHIAHWLPQISEVLAFHSAQKQHGGSGATYIMLKKSERKRQEKLERHQKRR